VIHFEQLIKTSFYICLEAQRVPTFEIFNCVIEKMARF